jgi:hypothetical protein
MCINLLDIWIFEEPRFLESFRMLEAKDPSPKHLCCKASWNFGYFRVFRIGEVAGVHEWYRILNRATSRWNWKWATFVFNWTIKVCQKVIFPWIQFQSGLTVAFTVIYILSIINFIFDFSKCFKLETFATNLFCWMEISEIS